MHVDHLELVRFRNYEEAVFEPSPEGVTLLRGDNGAGKTNVLEAVGYVTTLRSFRGTGAAALVRQGSEQAVLRAEVSREGRRVLVEVELNPAGRDRVRLNRQPLRRSSDLLSAVSSTVFTPDDIEVVKGGPGGRRDYLDDLLAALHPRNSALLAELERVLRQRNALLRSSGGLLRAGMAETLDVWDAKLAQTGELVAQAREELVEALQPEVAAAYKALSAAPSEAGRQVVRLRYERSWQGPLAEAVARARSEDLRRAVTSAGPHRDDLVATVNGLTSRGQSSQGEQRSLALAIRLGGHALVTARQGSSPVLLLDDIFSELDPGRCAALAHCLPPGQALLTTAGAVPGELPVARCYRVSAGTLTQL